MAKTNIAARGLFIDLDGTLADSLDVLRVAYFRFLEKCGCSGNAREFLELNGPKLADIVHILRLRYRLPAEASELVAIYNQLIDEAYEEVLPMSGAVELLEHAAQKGWSLIVVTSNLRTRAQAWLAKHKFLSSLHLLISGEEVLRGKPFPDLYQLAISRSGCNPTDSIAVEDSPQGARAALDAGLRTFVFGSQIEKAPAWPEHVEFILRWEDLLAWI